MRRSRLFSSFVLVGALLIAPTPTAVVAAADAGVEGPSYAGAGGAPTGEKPESKVWFNDGIWWSSMWDAASGRYEIFRLNGETWSSTNVPLDTRSNSRADTLWNGTKLYVASHVFSESPASGHPSFLYRFSYNAAADTYSLDAMWPQQINNVRSETLVIDQDSTGQLWATWVQNDSAGKRRVHVNRTTTGDSTWGTPFVIPGSSAHTQVASDDISAVVAFGSNRIGVLWSNQRMSPKSFVFMYHDDAAADNAWSSSVAISGGSRFGDDHVNLKSLVADGSGRVFAAIKTSNTGSSETSIALLQRSAGGSWSTHQVWRVSDGMTRPIVLLDAQNQRVHAFASDEGGGSVFTKSSSIASMSFGTGPGTRVIHDDSHRDVNDVTSTKQSVNNASGLLVLASNDTTQRYWHHFDPLSGSPPPPPPTGPTASFTATPASGTAPLGVSFTDTSTGGPTTWTWDFTDDGTPDATTQNAAHTYDTAGTYTARLTVSNDDGTSSTTRTISVAPTGGGGGGGTVTLTPTDDTYADSGAPTSPKGNANNLRVRAGSKSLHTYVKFVVAGVGPIDGATLRLWVIDASNDGGSLYLVPSNTWTEGSLTWANKPPTSGAAIDAAGAAPLGSWVELDVSGVVTGDGTYSFALVSGSNDVARYTSSEGSAANRPQLVLSTP